MARSSRAMTLNGESQPLSALVFISDRKQGAVDGKSQPRRRGRPNFLDGHSLPTRHRARIRARPQRASHQFCCASTQEDARRRASRMARRPRAARTCRSTIMPNITSRNVAIGSRDTRPVRITDPADLCTTLLVSNVRNLLPGDFPVFGDAVHHPRWRDQDHDPVLEPHPPRLFRADPARIRRRIDGGDKLLAIVRV